MSYWDSPEGLSKNIPENFESQYLIDERIYQPPIVRTDHPFYWLNDHTEFDEEWLWNSATLNFEDLQNVYLTKFSDHMDMFPDIITTRIITHKTPSVEFRLSDNGYLPDNHIETTVTITTHPENSFLIDKLNIELILNLLLTQKILSDFQIMELFLILNI